MNFDHMPAAKWIVTGSTLFGDSPEIINQETTDLFNNGVYDVVSVENGVVTLEVSYFYQNGVREDIVKLTPAKSTADGYFNADTKNKYYTLNYLSVNDGLAISVGNSTVGKDTILRVSSEATKFDLVGYNLHHNFYYFFFVFYQPFLFSPSLMKALNFHSLLKW